jgi:hypothetical protein
MVELLQPEVDIAVGALLSKAGGEAPTFQATWDLDERVCLPEDADPLRQVCLFGRLLPCPFTLLYVLPSMCAYN